jgi:hypothetical protein
VNDAAEPGAHSILLGDTPGPLGANDWADPNSVSYRLRTNAGRLASQSGPVVDPRTGRPVLLAAEGRIPGILAPPGRKPTLAEIDLGQRIVTVARARAEGEIGASYRGISKALLTPNPNYKGANPHPDKTPVRTLEGNKCNIYLGDVLYQAGAQVPAVPQKGGGEKYDYPENFGKSRAFTVLARGDEIIPGDIVVRTLDGSVHTEVINAVSIGGVRIVGAIGAHWEGVGPSPLNVRAYNRGLAGGYDFKKRTYHWKEPDGSVGELLLLRARPR